MSNDRGIRQIGKNRYEVRVQVLSARNGRKQNRKATITGTKEDARATKRRLVEEARSTVARRSKIPLHEFAASWLDQRSPSLKPSTIRRYKASMEHIVPVLGDLYIDAIAPSDVQAYVNDRVKVVGVKGGASVMNELRMLRTMAKDAVADGYVDRDWCARVKPPAVRRYTKARPNRLTAEQSEIVLAEIPKQWLGLVLFCVTTGLRWGEASALRWEDVDLENHEAAIRRANDRGTPIGTTKTGKERTVPALPEVIALWGTPKDRGLVFPARSGKLHKGTPLIKVLTKACERAIAKHPKAGITRVTVQGLRRTFNNEARKTTSREVLKSITGHTTDAMVEHYSFIEPTEKRTAARAVARSMGIVKGDAK